MNRRRLFLTLFASLLLPSAHAVSFRGADEAFVSVRNDQLVAGETPVVFACATGVRLPWPDFANAADEAARTSVWEKACADCGNLARRYAAAGFNMVRLPDLEAESSAAPSWRKDLQNEFLLACRRVGIRVWADPLHSLFETVIPPEAASLAGDSATQEAWREAVAAAGSSAFLAAAWDPRIAAFEQRLLRDWARSFNPATGLRRCDDPVFALFGFSFYWMDEMLSPDRPPLPAFLEDGLRAEWNAWLLERYHSDKEFSIWYGALGPGESLASNSVPFRSFGDPELTNDLRRDQERFLSALRDRRIESLLAAFRTYGRAAREAPRFVTDDGERALSAFSTIVPMAENAVDTHSAPPLLLDAFDADSPEEAYEAARRAAVSGVRVLALPCRDDPEAFALAAQVFRAGRNTPDSLPKTLPDTLNLPNLSFGTTLLPSDSSETPPLLFPASGAGVTLVRFPKGTHVIPVDSISGANVRLQLCIRPSRKSKNLSDAPEESPDLSDLFLSPDDSAPNEETTASDENEPVPDADPEPAADSPAPPEPVLRLESSAWKPEGEDVIIVRLRVVSEDTGKDVPFGLLASGPGLAKKVCVPMDDAGSPLPTILPVDGAFRLHRLTSELLRFEPAPIGTRLLPGR